jgi:hypothetical protein
MEIRLTRTCHLVLEVWAYREVYRQGWIAWISFKNSSRLPGRPVPFHPTCRDLRPSAPNLESRDGHGDLGDWFWRVSSTVPNMGESTSIPYRQVPIFHVSKYPDAKILGVDLSLEQHTKYAPNLVTKSTC